MQNKLFASFKQAGTTKVSETRVKAWEWNSSHPFHLSAGIQHKLLIYA